MLINIALCICYAPPVDSNFVVTIKPKGNYTMTSIDLDRKVEWPGKDNSITLGAAFLALREHWGPSVDVTTQLMVGRDGQPDTIIEAWPIYPTH
jgi:hypothetical protein